MPKKDKEKPNNRPKPWYLGWGLARFAGDAIEKRKKEQAKKMADAQK